jgi:hypothetical protein
MPRKAQWPPPIYTRRGRDFVRLRKGDCIRDIALGAAGSPEAQQEYTRILTEIASVGPEHVLSRFQQPRLEFHLPQPLLDAFKRYVESLWPRPPEEDVLRRIFEQYLASVGFWHGSSAD